ncbi:pyridoxamine 5'-phosphate oxidase family protein [Paenibacillus lupini]|uniref:pyridoxamine 5'-phosphate oxidase family protein n=1 Tax=Paenibacillus lupini TaxID=1450204 RepID=UPI0014218AE5|nr:pyridoxamine 5'-phosphate oxidase family protein [Paenibacillus lupini]NIK21606.1 putative pyridoxine 5'-phosphate oxidase superfamily flavin-nucleotide-binding protein [Paenibacillus lupini]
MGTFLNTITSDIREFINNQHLFFVGTAPTEAGEVSVSPKGYDTLRIIGESKILYLDYYGSGNETAIHLNQNKKITFMWCSFEEEPLILRVYGRGKVLDKGTEGFTATLNEQFSGYDERIVRQIFEIDVLSVQTSCGWGVPFMNYDRDRSKLDDMSKKSFD